MLRASPLIVHHGGIGVSEAALMAGRVQLLLPRHLEHVMNAKSLMQLGAAVVVGAPFSRELMGKALSAVMLRDAVRQSAQSAAQTIEAQMRGKPGSLETVLALCESGLTHVR